jgi:leader peptidase (prepilin peptidase)/N-methyltransferase
MTGMPGHLVTGLIAGAGCSPVAVSLLRRTVDTEVRQAQLVAAVVVTTAAGGAVGTWPPAVIAAGAGFVLLGVPAALVDAVEHRIPNRLTLPLATASLVALAVAVVMCRDPGGAQRALGGGTAWGLLFLLSFLLTGQPGPGDVKLAPSAGMLLGWFGWSWVIAGLAATYLLTASAGMVGVATGRYRLHDGQVPMGPTILAVVLAAGTLASR